MAPKVKGKATASQQPPPPIEDLFSNLNRHIERSEFEQAVKVADQVLSVAPNDEDAIRCKVVALIKCDSIDKALSTIHSAQRQNLPFDFSYFKAYCLYRQNKLDEALESLKGLERTSETMLLESQILFRLGKMDACVDVYQKLQKSKIDTLEINLVAGLILAGKSSQVQGMMEANRIKASSSFELAYNTACSLIERNKYTDAEQLLLTARRVGQEALMDDNLAEDDIEIELAPIAVQLAYVQQLLGRSPEAMEAYTEIINRNLADESSFAVAVNNLIALKGSKDVSDNLRKLDRLKEQDAQAFQLARGLDKLSPKQKEAIYANRVLLLLHTNKMDQVLCLAFCIPFFLFLLLSSIIQVMGSSAYLDNACLLPIFNRHENLSLLCQTCLLTVCCQCCFKLRSLSERTRLLKLKKYLASLLRSSLTSLGSFFLQGRKLLLLLAIPKLQPTPCLRYLIFSTCLLLLLL
ncbi:hypothetical protein H0E87_012065 [Populus deltoides]|uniref:Signal recognition particle subunit SRP72 n=1 Tax=Populus deltoides TaxID=3696 RepID=A0A8T2YHS8_POPDE|nr:hypothetical protein H0E87_012065 [Populus deltoides]